MKGGGGGGGRRRVGGVVPPTDLLVCFPTRAAHLTLMPKPTCSPSRPPAIHQNKSYRHHHRHSPARPLFRTNKATSKSRIGCGDVISSEPTSPKVTCAGQIKVRPKNGRPAGAPDSKNWLESIGLKKDVMNFLGTLRGLRFNMGCFGAFNAAPIVCTSDDEDEQEEEEEEEEEEAASGSSQCKTILSKWFMALDESQGKGGNDVEDGDQEDELEEEELEEEEKVELPPPPNNALLLMRCRSAPARRRGEVERNAVPDSFKVLTDIAMETWLVQSVDPMLARSRSWRR